MFVLTNHTKIVNLEIHGSQNSLLYLARLKNNACQTQLKSIN